MVNGNQARKALARRVPDPRITPEPRALDVMRETRMDRNGQVRDVPPRQLPARARPDVLRRRQRRALDRMLEFDGLV